MNTCCIFLYFPLSLLGTKLQQQYLIYLLYFALLCLFSYSNGEKTHSFIYIDMIQVPFMQSASCKAFISRIKPTQHSLHLHTCIHPFTPSLKTETPALMYPNDHVYFSTSSDQLFSSASASSSRVQGKKWTKAHHAVHPYFLHTSEEPII